MSKPKRHPDQVAIDLATVGSFLIGSCGTYRALGIAEAMAEEAGNSAEAAIETYKESASLIGDVLSTASKYGPLGPVVLGRTDRDEIAWIKDKLGIGRKGGLFK